MSLLLVGSERWTVPVAERISHHLAVLSSAHNKPGPVHRAPAPSRGLCCSKLCCDVAGDPVALCAGKNSRSESSTVRDLTKTSRPHRPPPR